MTQETGLGDYMTPETDKGILTIKAYAKINLYLDVISRYPDGYHRIESVMQSISLCDILEISETTYPEIDVRCTTEGLSGPRNLAFRAAEALRRHAGVKQGAAIAIRKHIPVAAGLAGGSADAAATLTALNRLWGLDLGGDELAAIGAALGADIPFCLVGGTMLAEGKGELLSPLEPMPDTPLVVATPPIPVSTAEVYRAFDDANPTPLGRTDAVLAALRQRDAGAVARSLGNLLENVALKRYPAILEAKERALAAGAEGVLMSGSGPSVFAICRDEPAARGVASAMREHDMAMFVETVRPVRAGVEFT